MKFIQRRYSISPAIVPSGKSTTVTIKGHGQYHRFFDDVEYIVRVIPKEEKDYSIDDDLNIFAIEFNTVKAKVQDGVLSFDYIFRGEQEWAISVMAKNKDHDPHTDWMHPLFSGKWSMQFFDDFKLDFRVYSLEEDLYGCKAYKGDPHIHTEFSDGYDSPEQFCSHYRGFGYDFVAVTDHYEYPASLRAIDKMSELQTNFTVFPGEEVHVKQSGRFHMVNFNGKSSVNTKIRYDYDQVKAEVKELAKKFDEFDESEAMELAWTQWITEEIRKTGGISIYPHPYWTVKDIYNHSTHTSKEIFKHRLFDVFEIVGGFPSPAPENNLQATLYYELRGEGYRFPVVGASDAHIGTDHGQSSCAINSTCVFAKSPEDIPDAILASKSTAVSHYPNEPEKVYGEFRLVRYTHFLLENYFPMHTELCKASSVMISEYFKGYKDLKPAIELAEKRVAQFEKEFFGR